VGADATPTAESRRNGLADRSYLLSVGRPEARRFAEGPPPRRDRIDPGGFSAIDLIARIDAALSSEGSDAPAARAIESLLVEGVTQLADAHRTASEARLDLEWAIDHATDRVAPITRQLRELSRSSDRLRIALDRLLQRYEEVRAPQRPGR
jgi:hypothetical protein